MTAFDLIFIGLVALSTLFGFWQGFVRMVGSLVAWVVGIIAAVRFSSLIGALLPDFGESTAVRYVIAFAIILVLVLLAGGLIAFLVSHVVQAAGLGFVDRILGAVAGLVRGVLVAVLLVLVAGVTDLPKSDWWQNATFGPALVAGALSLRPWLPKGWADQLDYGRPQRGAVKHVARLGVKRTVGN